MSDTSTTAESAADSPAATAAETATRRSGNEAVADAAQRADSTREHNIDTVPAIPIPADTANVRQGPEINDACLPLLPLVGIWRGTGMFGNEPTGGPPQFGQQITISHDGRPFLRYESVSWQLDPEGNVTAPDARELGWLRPQDDDSVELLIAHAEGRIEVFYGRPQTLTSWALATDGTWRTASAPPVIGSSRLYGITADGRLAYVEERAEDGVELSPHSSATLERIAG